MQINSTEVGDILKACQWKTLHTLSKLFIILHTVVLWQLQNINQTLYSQKGKDLITALHCKYDSYTA